MTSVRTARATSVHRRGLSFPPLTARSVVLSTLLGSHPPQLPARALVRAGALFGITEGTVRVALTRMVAAGDLQQRQDGYRLTDRLVARQTRQDDSRAPRARRWNGCWEIAVVGRERRSASQRSALRQAMAEARMAELREGSWLRPANLRRDRPAVIDEQCTVFTGVPAGDPVRLAGELWDLTGWARHARALLAAFTDAAGPADQFTVCAAVLRHLVADPQLPARLLPPDWPGAELRRRYSGSERALRDTVLGHLANG